MRVSVAPREGSGGSHVTVRVDDTGIGIPRDKVPTIWGAFEQVSACLRQKHWCGQTLVLGTASRTVGTAPLSR